MDQIGNSKSENYIFTSRVRFAFVFILLLSLVLIGRTYNLQVVNHEFYVEEALGNQLRELPIAPLRGKIFDRHGKVLATNQLAYRLTLTPEKIKNVSKTLLTLKAQGFIEQADIDKFHKQRSRYKKFHQIPLKHNLDEIRVAQFLTSNQLPGVEVESYFQRVYPNGTSSVHALGYVSRMSKQDKALYDKQNYLGTDFVGKTGVEREYETLLHGASGIKQVERNVVGRVVDTKILKPAVPGTDLYLSLDLEMQKTAETLLADQRGAIVVMDVNTGEVLTLVSTPTYDPNWFVNGISHQNYNSLQTSKDIPMLNRTIQGLYPPGSTVKPMVALAGLEEGFITDQSSTFCPGYFKLPNVKRKFRDWKRTGHDHVNANAAIAESCDVFFYDLADKMGIDKLNEGLGRFNFGESTGIDIPGEKGGVLPSREWKKINRDEPWYRGETLITGIGQGFMTTSPLQLAVATAALANKGQILKPKLLKNTQAPGEPLLGTPVTAKQPIPIKNIHNWEEVIEGMKQTVYGAKGTARRINKDMAYTLAGKTGTAQVFGLDAEEQYIAEKIDEHLRDHALFTGFAPIDKPEVAVAVIVENGGSGSITAAPMAKAVLDVYFHDHLFTPTSITPETAHQH